MLTDLSQDGQESDICFTSASGSSNENVLRRLEGTVENFRLDSVEVSSTFLAAESWPREGGKILDGYKVFFR